MLLQDPNPDDPLNKEAANMLTSNPRQFELFVQRSIQSGHTIEGTFFPPCSA